MNAQRKGEIAYELLKFKLKKEGIRISQDIRRESGDIAQKTGIPAEEVAEFSEIIIREMVNEMFATPARK